MWSLVKEKHLGQSVFSEHHYRVTPTQNIMTNTEPAPGTHSMFMEKIAVKYLTSTTQVFIANTKNCLEGIDRH